MDAGRGRASRHKRKESVRQAFEEAGVGSERRRGGVGGTWGHEADPPGQSLRDMSRD